MAVGWLTVVVFAIDAYISAPLFVVKVVNCLLLTLISRPVTIFDSFSYLKLGCFKRKESQKSLLAPGFYMAGNFSELDKRQVLTLWPWRLQLKHRRSARQRCLDSSESPERGGRRVKAGRGVELEANEYPGRYRP